MLYLYISQLDKYRFSCIIYTGSNSRHMLSSQEQVHVQFSFWRLRPPCLHLSFGRRFDGDKWVCDRTYAGSVRPVCRPSDWQRDLGWPRRRYLGWKDWCYCRCGWCWPRDRGPRLPSTSPARAGGGRDATAEYQHGGAMPRRRAVGHSRRRWHLQVCYSDCFDSDCQAMHENGAGLGK